MVLSIEQAKAVETRCAAARVIAGAGSGKTRVIEQRIQYLVDNIGVSPEKILALSFSRNSAAEISNRINEPVEVKTIHGMCFSLLKKEQARVANHKISIVAVEMDSEGILWEIIRKIIDKNSKYKNLVGLETDTHIRAKLKELRNILLHNFAWFPYLPKQKLTLKEAQRLFDKYSISFPIEIECGCKKCNRGGNQCSFKNPVELMLFYTMYRNAILQSGLMSFDDIEYFAYLLLDIDKQVRLRTSSRYHHIIIDEYQDTSKRQEAIFHRIDPENIFVVGDDDQAIYEWRGASPFNIIDFENQWQAKDPKTFFLLTNYRSNAHIVDASEQVITENKIRVKNDQAKHSKPYESKIHYAKRRSSIEEALFVGEEIRRFYNKGILLENCAVIALANYQLEAAEKIIQKEYGFPCFFHGKTPDVQANKKDANLAYQLTILLLSPRDDVAMTRAVQALMKKPDKIGDALKTMNSSSSLLLPDPSVWDIVRKKLEEETINIDEKRLENCRKRIGLLLALIEKTNGASVETILSNIKQIFKLDIGTFLGDKKYQSFLSAPVDEYAISSPAEQRLDSWIMAVQDTSPTRKNKPGHVTFMTIYATKGLEFQNVFLIGLEKRLWLRYVDDDQKVEEKRRLLYVAMTRAEKQLYLTKGDGEVLGFLESISEEHLHKR